MKKHTPPTIKTLNASGCGAETEESHPSYGLISIGRYTCNPAQNFFGSSIKHHAGVSISIRKAVKQRHLSDDWYHGGQELIEVNLTPAQLANMLTNMNIGEGTPCTLNRILQTKELQAEYPDCMVPYCPETTMRQQYETEFKKDMKELASSIDGLVEAARALQSKPNVTKADRAAFTGIAEGIRAKMANCIPFVHSQFNEALDKVITEAKADIESFTTQLANSLGSAALAAKISDAKPDVQLALGGGEDYTTPQQ
jgi:hypothetical protein